MFYERMIQEAIIGFLVFVVSTYLGIIFKLKTIIEKYVESKEKEFFDKIAITTSVNKILFEDWMNEYYRINEPRRNLFLFHNWTLILIPLLFISLLIDIFRDKIPKELNGAIWSFSMMTAMVIILFFMQFFYLVNWYMKEYEEQ